MEQTASAKRVIVAAALLAVAVAATLAYYGRVGLPLSRMIAGDVPMLDLFVVMQNLQGNRLDPAATALADRGDLPVADEHCPLLQGGDSYSATVASSDVVRPADCSQRATWFVKSRPIALSVYVNDGPALQAWYDGRSDLQTLVANRFVRGLLFGLLQSLKVRAEQLQLDGLRGELLGQWLRDALAAKAQLHYDLVHGRRGWVFSFERRSSGFAAQALPAMVGLLADSGYRINKLPQPVVNLTIGTQRLLLTEYRQRLYMAYSLEALLNVIENLPPLSSEITAVPLAVTLRGEALLDNLLPVMAGKPNWEATLAFSLQTGDAGTLHVPRGPWIEPLRETLFEGVLAGIPHDVFAAVAASWALAPTWTGDDWRALTTAGVPRPQNDDRSPGGFALIWDFDARHGSGMLGIAVANPANPQASAAYRQYLQDPELAAECGGGSVFLAASADSLLLRMKEACERQSLSTLDWSRGTARTWLSDAQLLTFVNPGVGLRELFLAGGAGSADDADEEFAPDWKREYLQAKAAMRQDGERLFAALPIFSFAGRVGEGDHIVLPGRIVAQGGGQ